MKGSGNGGDGGGAGEDQSVVGGRGRIIDIGRREGGRGGGVGAVMMKRDTVGYSFTLLLCARVVLVF